MVVTVEGLITSIEVVKKDDKKYTTLLLAQKGEKEQVTVRLSGDQSNLFTELERNTFTGRLMTWTQGRNNLVNSMVIVQEEE